MIAGREELAIDRAEGIMGWMSRPELLFLADTASRCELIYEIGSFMGRSTRALADNTDGIVVCIDPWDGANYQGNEKDVVFTVDDSIYNIFYCNLADHIKSGKVIPVASKWSNYYWLDHRRVPPKAPNFIFIDGDHRYTSVVQDIYKAIKHLMFPGSILAGHDYTPGWPGVMKAVNESFPSLKINVVDTIWWVKL